ncbi:hypothetical protein pEpSNUABM09_02 [Erwinia phage pEp_SNUABM_09]|uniref:Uncharacterized protein n=1 Tax=Erwinia phage pEp_SNUABM_09 TaxID=2601644 RepID=A0A5J6DA36_9CAUD|nr:hypothetical protein pEpSNUABM09_02 [Erwinia phage pEp_SNUABM_09]QOC57656.1 hypothetical protein pEp_SNUABM04_00002 [Erwinia phage pEp_SNUABM_04]
MKWYGLYQVDLKWTRRRIAEGYLTHDEGMKHLRIMYGKRMDYLM